MRSPQHASALVTRATAVVGTFQCRGEGHGRFELAGAGWSGEEIGVRGLFGVTAQGIDDTDLPHEGGEDIAHANQPMAARAVSTRSVTVSSVWLPLITIQFGSCSASVRKP